MLTFHHINTHFQMHPVKNELIRLPVSWGMSRDVEWPIETTLSRKALASVIASWWNVNLDNSSTEKYMHILQCNSRWRIYDSCCPDPCNSTFRPPVSDRENLHADNRSVISSCSDSPFMVHHPWKLEWCACISKYRVHEFPMIILFCWWKSKKKPHWLWITC
jgi:hypothetical protein